MSHTVPNLSGSLLMAQVRRMAPMRERVTEACRLVEGRSSVCGAHIVARGAPTRKELVDLHIVEAHSAGTANGS